MSRPPSSTVFVGNIPYDVTEQMLNDVFSEVGSIKSLRLVMDKDSGKPKGYGFCEYYDRSTAECAVRNLNGREVSSRALRVDFAEDHSAGGGPGGDRDGGGRERDRGDRDRKDRRDQGRGGGSGAPGTRPVGQTAANTAAQLMATMLGGSQNPHQQGGMSGTIASMTPVQLYEIMTQMKALVGQNQAAARQILVQSPQLTRALFQAQITLGMVKPPAGAAQQQQQVPPQQPPPQQPPVMLPPPQQQPMVMAQPAPVYPPAQPQQYGGLPLPGPGQPQPQVIILPGGGAPPQPMMLDPVTQSLTAYAPQQQQAPPPPQLPPQVQQMQQPVQQQSMMMQPQQPAQAPAPAAAPISNDQQAALLTQLMSLTPEQLEALPPAEKAQAQAIIQTIRAQQQQQQQQQR